MCLCAHVCQTHYTPRLRLTCAVTALGANLGRVLTQRWWVSARLVQLYSPLSCSHVKMIEFFQVTTSWGWLNVSVCHCRHGSAGLISAHLSCQSGSSGSGSEIWVRVSLPIKCFDILERKWIELNLAVELKAALEHGAELWESSLCVDFSVKKKLLQTYKHINMVCVSSVPPYWSGNFFPQYEWLTVNDR